MSLLDHQELSLVRGVGKTPGDLTSAESDLVIVDLLTSGSAFGLVEWVPNIPSLKQGGIWADSSISDGRTLIAGVNTNVTETMTIQLTGSTIADFANQFAKLQRMIQDARDFWDTFYQIEPVYIRWWANQAPGPQFALIYNIDMDVEWSDSNLAQATLTLTIEREFGWRGVRPGGNPKEWTLFKRGVPFTASNADVANDATTAQLAQNLTAVNKLDWNVAHTIPSTQNYVEIPASAIPGDLPAKCLLSIDVANAGLGTEDVLLAWRTTKNTSILARNGTTYFASSMFNANDSSLGTDATLVADTGASAGNRVRVTLATVSFVVNRIIWSYLSTQRMMINLMRGRFQVFLRCRLSAAANVSIKGQLLLGPEVTIDGNVLTLTDVGAGGTGNTTEWVLLNLGVFEIAPYAKAYSSPDGKGLNAPTTLVDAGFAINAIRNSGAGELYLNDVIFLPVDEPSARFQAQSGGAFSAALNRNIIYDNTGYIGHGITDDISLYGTYNAGTQFVDPQAVNIATQGIVLLPNQINRIYALTYVNSNQHSTITSSFKLRVNIVPMWSGIRTE